MSVLIGGMFMFSAPVSLCLLLISQILLCSALMFTFVSSLWVILVFMIIFFGGLMVLFIYISSVAQNDLLCSSVRQWWVVPLIMIVSLGTPPMSLSANDYCSGLALFTSDGWALSVGLISYLLLVLILVVKISRVYFGSLRTT